MLRSYNASSRTNGRRHGESTLYSIRRDVSLLTGDGRLNVCTAVVIRSNCTQCGMHRINENAISALMVLQVENSVNAVGLC